MHELIKRLIQTLSSGDDLFAEKAARLRPGELACRAGCFGCCVGLFTIGLPEAFAVRQAVAALPAAAREEVLARAARAVARGAATFPGDSAAGILDPERGEESEGAWFAAVRETACPALELPSGRCLVYASRPTTCRTYGLALRAGGETLVPACELNFPGAPPDRARETAIDARRLTAVDQALAEIASEAGLPAGAETSVAHALTGSAFVALERRSRRG
jgi:Fe-S-cluster containining protein